MGAILCVYSLVQKISVVFVVTDVECVVVGRPSILCA